MGIDGSKRKDSEEEDVVEEMPSLRDKFPRIRRRSSNFRPTNFYDKALIKSEGVNLEMLPLVIITKIFTNLATSDLLNVCVSSRLLYVPAMMQLYKRILIINDEDDQLYLFIKQMIDQLPSNFGTICKCKNMSKLSNVLKNKKIGNQVRLIIFVNDKLDFNNALNYEQLLRLTEQGNMLTEFINPCITADIADKLELNHVRSLTFALKPCDLKRTQYNFPSLRSLTVLYENDPSNIKSMEQLALGLASSTVLDNLNELEFKELADMNLKALNEVNENLNKSSIWIHFFTVLQHHPKRYSLTKLVLDGAINSQGREIARVLNQRFDLTCLEELNLDIVEFSHLNEHHYENQNDLLINMASYCTKLKKLAITPTFNCLKCQLELTINTLNNLRGKLISLDVKFETLNYSHTKRIYHTILASQGNLQQLILYDKSNEFHNASNMIKHVSNFTAFERGTFSIGLFLKHFPQQLTFEQYLQLVHTMNSFYSANGRLLAVYLGEYLKELELSSELVMNQLPSLRYLFVNHILVREEGGKLVVGGFPVP